MNHPPQQPPGQPPCRAVVEFENVSFSYPAGPGHPVLENATFTICEHQTACIIGPNGGGKTTIINLILGAIRPATGSVRVLGADPLLARTRIGYMPQYMQFDQLFPISVLEVVLMGNLDRHPFGRYGAKLRQAALAALEEMEIQHLANRHFGALSGGQRQRTLIARALVSKPALLLLDEPTANVDPAFQAEFYSKLHSFRDQMTVIIVSHDLGFVSQQMDSVICVHRSVRLHPTANITGQVIQELYGSELSMVRHDHCCSERGHSHV